MPDSPVRGLDSLSWVYREVLEWSLTRIAFLLLVAFATAFGLVQATTFNLDAAPLGHVLLWVGCALLCWPLWHAVLAGVLYLMRLRPPREVALAAGLATVFVTLPSTAVVHSVSAWVRGHYPGALAVYAEVAVPALLLSGLFLYAGWTLFCGHWSGTAMDGGSAAPTVATESPHPSRGLALLRLAHREMLDWSLIQASFFATAGLALVAAVVVPIGIVAQLGLPERLAYWSICGLLCWPPGHAVTPPSST